MKNKLNKKTAKIAGFLYLIFILDLFGKIGFGDAETIINYIVTNGFWRCI